TNQFLNTSLTSGTESTSLISRYQRHTNKNPICLISLNNRRILDSDKKNKTQTIDSLISTKISSKTLLTVKMHDEKKDPSSKLNSLIQLCEKEEKTIENLSKGIREEIK